jgi:exodeoxyribonuclease VII large subunit
MTNDVIFAVGQLNEYVKSLLGEDEVLASVAVRGELSNYKLYPSGHHYFTLKDSGGALRCVMFKGSATRLRFRPENGMQVVAYGRVEVYVRDGAYQLIVSHIQPDGVGDLYTEYERLKEQLRREGLFDARHKKTILKIPDTIAVITSEAGAAVRDIIRVLGNRWPLAKVLVLPVRVQGPEAPAEIVAAIRCCNQLHLADLIITGRGGGSIEDLWAFNDERVARAIFASDLPVISAVGHEPDVTIADFVADVRAATPSNAAELAVPDRAEVRGDVKYFANGLQSAAAQSLQALRRRLLAAAQTRAMRSPQNYLDDRRLTLDHSHERISAAAKYRITKAQAEFSRLAAALDALSPFKVLGRGYAIARDADGQVIKRPQDVNSGDKLSIRLQKGEINCTVD